MATTTVTTWVADHGLDTVEPVNVAGHCCEAVVGAYTLAEDQKRVGGLYLVRANLAEPSLTPVAFVSLPAVLDSRVLNYDDSTVALAACADGTLRCLKLPSLCELWVFKHGPMLTSVSVARREINGRTLVALSDAKGGITLLKVTARGFECQTSVAGTHDAEAWTVDATDDVTVVSGGDDGYLRVTDFRTSTSTWKRRAHDGVGVTAVVCRSETELWTGGYDDCVRVWDRRAMKRALLEENLSGGVWRLKFHERQPNLVLAACMYDGFKVLDVNTASNSLAVQSEYRGHDSIAYGAAWLPEAGEDNSDPLALTASFYDKSLQLWRAQKK